jgi:hypothetical protein
LILIKDFRIIKKNNNNIKLIKKRFIISISFKLVFKRLINFISFFLKYIFIRSKDYYFINFVKVFILMYRMRLSIIYFKGASLVKRLDRRAFAIWNFILTKLKLN